MQIEPYRFSKLSGHPLYSAHSRDSMEASIQFQFSLSGNKKPSILDYKDFRFLLDRSSSLSNTRETVSAEITPQERQIFCRRSIWQTSISLALMNVMLIKTAIFSKPLRSDIIVTLHILKSSISPPCLSDEAIRHH